MQQFAPVFTAKQLRHVSCRQPTIRTCCGHKTGANCCMQKSNNLHNFCSKTAATCCILTCINSHHFLLLATKEVRIVACRHMQGWAPVLTSVSLQHQWLILLKMFHRSCIVLQSLPSMMVRRIISQKRCELLHAETQQFTQVACRHQTIRTSWGYKTGAIVAYRHLLQISLNFSRPSYSKCFIEVIEVAS